ncbi:MAG: hypothetical protein OXF49_01940 [Candidatus Saccharibacteria bacterium]|nr:hypothetical protein [Candidatus Saccharibacteria bacterium]
MAITFLIRLVITDGGEPLNLPLVVISWVTFIILPTPLYAVLSLILLSEAATGSPKLVLMPSGSIITTWI